MRIRIAVILVQAANLINVVAVRVAGNYDELWAAMMERMPNEELRTLNARAQNETRARAAKQ